ncbi:hypothetical protein ACJJTC_016301 [Scirpophaga incertulas]
MSEEIDLNTSNLCSAKETKFQSTSIYEEEELITLADIVPHTSKTLEQCLITPLTNPESHLEEQVPEVNSTIEVEHSEELVNKIDYCSLPKAKIRLSHGMQKGNSSNEIEAENCSAVRVFDNACNISVSNDTPKVQTKRGRKPKKKQNPNLKHIDKETTPSTSSIKVPTIDPSNDLLITSPGTTLTTYNTLNTSTVKKRGRPRKQPINFESNQENLDYNISNAKNCSNPDSSTLSYELPQGGLSLTSEPNKTDQEAITSYPENLNKPLAKRQRGSHQKLKRNKEGGTSIATKNWPKRRKQQLKGVLNETITEPMNTGHSEGKTVSTSEILPKRRRRQIIEVVNDKETGPINTKQLDCEVKRKRQQIKEVINEKDSEIINNSQPTAETKRRRQNIKEFENNKESEFLTSYQTTDEIASTSENNISEITDTITQLDNEHVKVFISDQEDDADDICLSKLKMTLESNNSDKSEVHTEVIQASELETVSCNNENVADININKVGPKRTPKKPLMSDFEYNIDSIECDVGFDNSNLKIDVGDSLLVESPTKRPVRQRVRATMHYDEESDEDPFANVETSEDEKPRRGKKGTKFYSDDEYFPGGFKQSSSDISETYEGREEYKKQKRKKKRFDITAEKFSRKGIRKPKTDQVSAKQNDFTRSPDCNTNNSGTG